MYFSLTKSLPALLGAGTAFAGPLHTVDVPATANRTSLSARDQKIGLDSGLTITFWGNPTCEDSVASLWPGITYLRNAVTNIMIMLTGKPCHQNSQISGLAAAYQLSRDLLPDEIIDVSMGLNSDKNVYTMDDAISPAGGQYPGSPGYVIGGWTVPSACNTYLESSPLLAPHLTKDGKKACYSPKRAFNCARLWMRS